MLTVLICGALASCGGAILSPEGGGGGKAPDGGNGPDLQVTSPAVSDSGPAIGTPFTLSATVRNAGIGSAPATTLRYYRSTDAAISQSDTAVGTAAVQELAASRSTSARVELVTPSTPGTYYYGACVDAVEGESDTANNCSSSVQITVAEPGPNLVVTSSSVNTSAPVAGTTFTLSATVRNDGDAASSITTMRFYRSPDATITMSDTEVATAVVMPLDAAAGGSQAARSGRYAARRFATSESGTSYYHGEVGVSAPSTAGTYYYGACVDAVTDESVTTDNCSSAVEVTVRSTEQHVQGDPDLHPYTIAIETGLASLSPGGSFTLSVGVRNEGNGTSAASTLRYYRSTVATVTASDTEVGTDDVPSLPPSATSTQTAILTAPTTPGTYYFGACVDAVTDESDTTDNCSRSVMVDVKAPAPPDLEVATPTVNDASPEAGATITLSATVSNTGDGASVATTLRFYRSTEMTTTTTHTQVGTAAVRALAASATSEGAISLAVPRGLGTYYYGACVDAVADESDTTNNCSEPLAVTPVEPEQPDGAPSVRISNASTTVTEGAAAQVEVTATSAPAADLDVYLSYFEYMNTGTYITYRPWPPPEPKVTIAAGSSSATLTLQTIDDSDVATFTLQVWIVSGRGYTIDPINFYVFVQIEDND